MLAPLIRNIKEIMITNLASKRTFHLEAPLCIRRTVHLEVPQCIQNNKSSACAFQNGRYLLYRQAGMGVPNAYAVLNVYALELDVYRLVLFP